jgi:hypothetical protein
VDQLTDWKGYSGDAVTPGLFLGQYAWWGPHQGREVALTGYSLVDILTCMWVPWCRKTLGECPVLIITAARSRPGYTVRC